MTDGAGSGLGRQSSTMRRRSRRESGQAAVETAIVMPLFVFIVLGLLQLGLMHQARLMAKYAAYKATRAGAINSAKLDVMQRAAAAVLVPFMAVGGKQQELSLKASQSDYVNSWNRAKNNINDWVAVSICSPGSSQNNGRDFDRGDQFYGGGRVSWEDQSATRLNVQVVFYYRLPIPFANGVLWWVTHGQENAELRRTLRIGVKQAESWKDGSPSMNSGPGTIGKQQSIAAFKSKADSGEYIMPIRTSYGMRMHSNILDTSKLPSSQKNSDCVINFQKK